MLSKKLFLSSILVFILLSFGFIVSVEASLTTWSRTYGGEDVDAAESVIQTSDGGYAIVGRTESFGGGLSSFWLVKTDKFGNMEWRRAYGGKSEVAYYLVETDGGGYAIVGQTQAFGAGFVDIWFVKTDAYGNMEWNKTYGGTDGDSGRSLLVTSDGGYAIAGHTVSFGAGNSDFWLIKTDEFGNMEWNRTYGGTENDIALSLVETSDGGYIIAGRTLLVKTDAVGNMKWNQTYDGSIRYLVATSDGGYAIAGTKNDDFWLVKTDEYGNMEWSQTYEGEGDDYANSLVATSDGGYAIAGEKSGDFWLIKTDKYGIIPEWYPPYICADSPQKTTYTTDNVLLNFTVNEETSWIGYSLDGQDNVTITETTLNLTELVNGSHNITVYATDMDGNTAASETIRFTVAKEKETEPPPPPATSWTTTAIAIAAVATAAAAALLIIYTKTKKK